MITKIRNSNFVRAPFVKVRNTNLTSSIANVLKQEGFIDLINSDDPSICSELIIALKYKVGKGSPYITNIVRVSKSGQRVYSSYKNLPRVLGGIGVAICLFQVV
jgi:small subunit ribosomal protein S8